MSIATMDEEKFISTINSYLLPSSPIRSEELLQGRTQQLIQIKKALSSPGRNVFIFGDRGVGKTSLAQTAAYLQQYSSADPILIGCDRNSTCFKVSQTIASRLLRESPTSAKVTNTKKIGAKYNFLAAEIQRSVESGKIPLPTTIDEAIGLIEFATQTHSHAPVIVVDEFERITEPSERGTFGDLIKQIGDQDVPAKFIFCGVGSSLNDLLAGHESCFRYLSAVSLDRLKVEPRMDIIQNAARALEVIVSRDYLVRIALISDGFPHYIHLIGTKLFWSVFEDQDRPSEVKAHHFTNSIHESTSEVEAHLRSIYDKATQKYNDEYQYVLWAAADHPDFKRRSTDIYESCCRIMAQLDLIPIDRAKFNNRINALKAETHGSILKGSRQGWYEFREPVLRGYCRLRAQQRNVILDREHYLELNKTLQP